MPFVLDEVFRRVGKRREDYIVLRPVNPACQYRWSDGSRLDIPFALEDVIKNIEQFAPGEGAHARAYLERLESLLSVPVDMISTGPDRDETIVRRHPFI